VQFAITGDVRRHEGHLLATVTVFDVTAGPRPIWAEHFNRPDTPGGRNGIVATVRGLFDEVATQAEVARAAREHPNNLDKRDLLFAAGVHPFGSREDALAKLALLERVLALDRDYLWAILNYADGHVSLVLDGYSTDREADLAIAGRYVDRAFQLSPDNYAALRIRGKILRARRDWVGLSAILQNLLARNPIDALRRRELGMVQMIQGQPKDALESFLAAKEMGAERSNIRLIDSNIALALLADGRYDEAIAQARVAMAQFQGDAGTNLEVVWLTLIAAEAWNGQVVQARTDLQAFLAAWRTYDRISAIPAGSLLAAQPRLLEGLRRAGMPEHCEQPAIHGVHPCASVQGSGVR
jgi:tetratricopeptide (TPR) repeat protein